MQYEIKNGLRSAVTFDRLGAIMDSKASIDLVDMLVTRFNKLQEQVAQGGGRRRRDGDSDVSEEEEKPKKKYESSGGIDEEDEDNDSEESVKPKAASRSSNRRPPPRKMSTKGDLPVVEDVEKFTESAEEEDDDGIGSVRGAVNKLGVPSDGRMAS